MLFRHQRLDRHLVLILLVASGVGLGVACAGFLVLEMLFRTEGSRGEASLGAALLLMGVSLGSAFLVAFRLQKRVAEMALEELDGLRERLRLGEEALRQAQSELGRFRSEIADRRAAEEKLKALTGQLERSNEDLQAFAYVASHDLQEPLRKVQTFGDRLRARCQDALTAEARDDLQRMQNAARRMQNLIDDLLLFSRVTTKPRAFEWVDLSKLILEVLSDLEVRILQSGGILQVGNLPELEADPVQMRQLFQNLISNALKFQRPGSSPIVQVHCRVLEGSESWPGPPDSAPPGGFCQISIEDNGIGFEEKYLDRMFAVFQRLHGRNVFEGTGIGLAICRKIVERHQGVITAKSRPGEGAIFIVSLPLKHHKGNG